MSGPDAQPADTPTPTNFPFVTVAVTLATLFVFLGLMWLAAQKENPLAEPSTDAKDEQKAEPRPKLDEIKARNYKALEGVGAKMSLADAHGKLLGTLKGPNDKLPFPTPEPPVVTAPAPKKDDKNDEEKKP